MTSLLIAALLICFGILVGYVYLKGAEWMDEAERRLDEYHDHLDQEHAEDPVYRGQA